MIVHKDAARKTVLPAHLLQGVTSSLQQGSGRVSSDRPDVTAARAVGTATKQIAKRRHVDPVNETLRREAFILGKVGTASFLCICVLHYLSALHNDCHIRVLHD